MIAVLSTYTCLLQAILYLCFSAFNLVFGNNHGFKLWQIGLTFVGLALGNVIACFCNPLWHRQWMSAMAKEKAKHGPEYKPQPELRLPPAIVGGPMLTVALFWFAWTTYPSVHWIVPIIATVFFSLAYVVHSYLPLLLPPLLPPLPPPSPLFKPINLVASRERRGSSHD